MSQHFKLASSFASLASTILFSQACLYHQITTLWYSEKIPSKQSLEGLCQPLSIDSWSLSVISLHQSFWRLLPVSTRIFFRIVKNFTNYEMCTLTNISIFICLPLSWFQCKSTYKPGSGGHRLTVLVNHVEYCWFFNFNFFPVLSEN